MRASLKPCPVPLCSALTTGGRCSAHTRQADRARGTASQRLYTWQWHKARTAYLADHLLCVDCEAEGVTTPASVVDHLVPHRGDLTLFWDTRNWRAVCRRCHSRKTATHDGGFGHERQVVDTKWDRRLDRWKPLPLETITAPSVVVDDQRNPKGSR
jgi:5-methylcytosine-specific restriction protein A